MVHARNRDARRRNGPLPAFPCTDSRRSACGRRPIRQTAPKRRAAARRKAGPYAAGHARAQLHDYTWGLLKAIQETKAVYRPKTRLFSPGSRIVLSGPASAVSCGESAPPSLSAASKASHGGTFRLRPQAITIRRPGQPNVRRSAPGRTRHALPRSRREKGRHLALPALVLPILFHRAISVGTCQGPFEAIPTCSGEHEKTIGHASRISGVTRCHAAQHPQAAIRHVFRPTALKAWTNHSPLLSITWRRASRAAPPRAFTDHLDSW